jgi:hypothetical protein
MPARKKRRVADKKTCVCEWTPVETPQDHARVHHVALSRAFGAYTLLMRLLRRMKDGPSELATERDVVVRFANHTHLLVRNEDVMAWAIVVPDRETACVIAVESFEPGLGLARRLLESAARWLGLDLEDLYIGPSAMKPGSSEFWARTLPCFRNALNAKLQLSALSELHWHGSSSTIKMVTMRNALKMAFPLIPGVFEIVHDYDNSLDNALARLQASTAGLGFTLDYSGLLWVAQTARPPHSRSRVLHASCATCSDLCGASLCGLDRTASNTTLSGRGSVRPVRNSSRTMAIPTPGNFANWRNVSRTQAPTAPMANSSPLLCC